jgi:hypothetical protein
MVWPERDFHAGPTPVALPGDDGQLEYYDDGGRRSLTTPSWSRPIGSVTRSFLESLTKSGCFIARAIRQPMTMFGRAVMRSPLAGPTLAIC